MIGPAPSTPRYVLLLVAATALAVPAAAAAAPAEATLDRTSFERRGNAICTTFLERQELLGKPKTREEFVSLGGKYIELAQDTHRRLRALEPPRVYATGYRRFLQATRKEISVAATMVAAVKNGDDDRLQPLLAQTLALEKRVDALAKSIGLTACGKP
jgi:hypothetical protein